MRVCILGSGLTSLTLAKALVNQNIYVENFSKQKKPTIDKSRTIGITKSNIEFFNNNIINIEKIIWKLNKIEIFSEKIPNEELLKFNNNEQLFSTVKNFKLEKILQQSLVKNKFYKKKYQDNLSCDHDNYDLIINLDFSNLISKKFFSKKIKKKYRSYAHTAILRHEKIKNNIARQIFTKIGPLAFLPISNSETSVVYSIKNSQIEKKVNFADLINHHNIFYKIEKIEKVSSFELNSISLRSYYYKNILAFGELIHKIHPLAGQGFNMTLRDIKILLKIIQNKQNLGLPLNNLVNQEFEQSIKHKNFIFSNGIDFVYEFFDFENKIKSKIFSNSLKYFGNKKSINDMFKRIADIGFN